MRIIFVSYFFLFIINLSDLKRVLRPVRLSMVMVMMPLIMLLLVRRIVLITLLLILLGRDGFQDVIRPFLGRVLLTVSFHRIHR